MADNELKFYAKLPAIGHFAADQNRSEADRTRLEPATCKEAEPFALRVLDDSMQPEFKSGCIIVIDPTGRATDGSFVLAKIEPDDSPIFRQLQKSEQGEWLLCALNEQYPETIPIDNLSRIMGVIVQRAGARRSYHKHYA